MTAAAAPQAPALPQPQATQAPMVRPAIKGLAFAVVALVALLCVAVSSRQRAVSPPPSTAAPAAQPVDDFEPEAEPEPNPYLPVTAAGTFYAALEAARPLMDDTRDEANEGAMALTARGMDGHLTAADIATLPETTFGAIMKDSIPLRGRTRLCVDGRVTEIQAVHAGSGTFYTGGIFSARGNVIRFMSFGDTEGIEATRRARLCGVVAGRYSYANVGGGTTHAVMIVGPFTRAAE